MTAAKEAADKVRYRGQLAACMGKVGQVFCTLCSLWERRGCLPAASLPPACLPAPMLPSLPESILSFFAPLSPSEPQAAYKAEVITQHLREQTSTLQV